MLQSYINTNQSKRNQLQFLPDRLVSEVIETKKRKMDYEQFCIYIKERDEEYWRNNNFKYNKIYNNNKIDDINNEYNINRLKSNNNNIKNKRYEVTEYSTYFDIPEIAKCARFNCNNCQNDKLHEIILITVLMIIKLTRN